MKTFRYIAVLVLYSLLLVLDFFFIVGTIGIAFDKKDVGAIVAGVVFSAFFIFLTVKCRSYSKKLDNAKDDNSKIEKVDVPKPSSKTVDVIAADSVSKRGKFAGMGCLVVTIPVVVACSEGWTRLLWLATVAFVFWVLVNGQFAKKNVKNQNKSKVLKSSSDLADGDGDDEPLWASASQKETGLKPNFEIKYKSAEDEVTVRKIYARNFDGKVLDAYCFLRNEDRTFYIPRIIECVDFETGEVLSSKANGDLRWYFNRRFKKNFKPSDMFEFREWNKITFSSFTPFLDDISGFDVDDDFKMRIVTYKDGFVSGSFHCGKVYSSMYEDDGFYLVLDDINGNRYNVDLNKIVSVEGVDDIGQYINDKFLNSNEGKARRLQKECEDELSIFVYLGRADDSSINEKKRRIICDYLTNTGRDCTNEILAIVAKRIKVDTNEFKKIVNAFSKCIDISAKPLFLEAADQIVGGRAKAKPFGLAGLQYIESKIKV